MAHENWNEMDNVNLDFEEHICAFLDILGYKAKVETFFNGDVNLYGRINRALKLANNSVIFLQQNREEIYTQMFSDSIIVHTKQKNVDFLLNYW